MNLKKKISCIETLLSFLNYIDSTVFWISSPDFKEQVYLTNSFERIWGHPVESLQNYPKLWSETLLPEDLKKNQEALATRSEECGLSLINFRIFRPDGTIRYLKDLSLTIADASGKPTAIFGFAEELTPEVWVQYHQNKITLTKKDRDCSILDELNKVFQNELKFPKQSIIIKNETLTESQDKTKKNKNHSIQYDGKIINISFRQYQCLEMLQQGYTAKETARKLDISFRTIEAHLDQLRRRFGISSKFLLAQKAILR